MAAASSAGATPSVPRDWHSIDWQKAHANVRRLQARIVQAMKAGKWGKVKALQHLLTHSFSAKALAVKRVTENQGKNTPGVDKVSWKTPTAKEMAIQELRQRGYTALPLRRLYIPKANGKQRPLGILTMKDRAMQALYLQSVDPIAETQADPNSYGFRKARSCADAIAQCHTTLAGRGAMAPWILEGAIKSCFDMISHPWLLNHIPMETRILEQWLKAGYMEKSVLYPTEEGAPQGGILSPVLANMALDGLEKILRETYPKKTGGKVHLVRYADDFIITGASKELLEKEAKPLVTAFLQERGLELSQEKTKITHIEDGFDFLGQHIRKYNGKVLIKPSKKNVHTFLTDIRKVIKGHKQVQTVALIDMLNPKIRGWALYHRHIASKETFSHVDHAIFQALWQWAKRRHPHKGKQWIKDRYFKRVGNRSWTFSGTAKDPGGKSTEKTLCKASSVPIKRQVKLQGACNPYDPAWASYLAQRHGGKIPPSLEGRKTLAYLWKEQGGICPNCDQPLTEITGWHNHHIVYKTMGGSDQAENRALVHPHCHRQIHAKGLAVSKPRPVDDVPQAHPGALFHA